MMPRFSYTSSKGVPKSPKGVPKSPHKFAYFYDMKVTPRLLLLSLALLVFAGCDSPEKKNAHRRGKPDSAGVLENSEALRPEVFQASPNKVDGCVGLYTYDSLDIAFADLDVDKGKKIFVTVAGGFAFFRLHGKDIYLKYDSGQSKEIDTKTSKEVYRGNDYTAVLETHAVRTEGETVWEAGTLEIMYKGRRFAIKVRGLSGC
jgi:hypothetical protein